MEFFARRFGGSHQWPAGPPAKNGIFAPFIFKKRSFCQDRLGTNIGKTQKKTVFRTASNGAKQPSGNVPNGGCLAPWLQFKPLAAVSFSGSKGGAKPPLTPAENDGKPMTLAPTACRKRLRFSTTPMFVPSLSW